MSGGFFEYDQYRINTIADGIQSELDKQGKEIPREDRWYTREDHWYKNYPEDRYYSKLSEETQKEFQNAIKYLRIAAVYAQRIDWFLSGDDGEENFHMRLKEELDELNKE